MICRKATLTDVAITMGISARLKERERERERDVTRFGYSQAFCKFVEFLTRQQYGFRAKYIFYCNYDAGNFQNFKAGRNLPMNAMKAYVGVELHSSIHC